LAGIKNSPEKKKAKADAEKARRLRKKEERAQKPPIDDLDTRRCKKIVVHAKQYPEKRHTTGDLVRGLKPKKDFKDLRDKTRRNCIDRLLKLAESGKLSMLSDHLTITRVPAKNRRTTFAVQYKERSGSST
jgi:hypothetical protein